MELHDYYVYNRFISDSNGSYNDISLYSDYYYDLLETAINKNNFSAYYEYINSIGGGDYLLNYSATNRTLNYLAFREYLLNYSATNRTLNYLAFGD